MLVLSDVHIGSRHSRLDLLRRCLAEAPDDDVLVAGDLFDDEHRPVDREEALRLMARAIEALGIRPRRLYVALSASSHDPLLPGPLMAKVDGVEVYAYNGQLRVEGGPVDVVAVHGDQAVPNGVLAFLLEAARPGEIGRRLRERLGLGPHVWLVYGHSHVPYVDPDSRILNPGPWKVYGLRRRLGNVYRLPPAEPLCKPHL